MEAPLRIGKLEIASRVLVAPMSGVSDLPFRRVVQRLRPGFVVSEMVAGRELCEGNADTELRAAGSGEITPLVIQLVGNDPLWMARGAARAQSLGADVVDINMGCPARKVTTGAAGSALMRDPDLALDIVRAVVGAVSVPVTLKMRLGWDADTLYAALIAREAEAMGVQLFTVHGRTRQQFYTGRADWRAVRAVVEAVRVPVVVNGDINSGETARQALAQSGAAAVMVGRPWCLNAVKAGLGEPTVPVAERGEVAVRHYRDMIKHYPAGRGVRVARKHVQGYLSGAGVAQDIISQTLRSTCPQEVEDALRAAFAGSAVRVAA